MADMHAWHASRPRHLAGSPPEGRSSGYSRAASTGLLHARRKQDQCEQGINYGSEDAEG
jgi:hypothetical protein